MRRLIVALGVVMAACGPPAYYVSNIYADETGLYTQRCPIDAGRNGDKPDPNNCRYERVGPPPPELRAQLPAAPPPGAPAAPPPAAPAPPP